MIINKKNKYRSMFENDVKKIKDSYSKEIVDVILDNTNFLLKEYAKWDNFLDKINKKKHLHYSKKKMFSNLEKQTTKNISKKIEIGRYNKIIIGIAGPGAVGKDTIKNKLNIKKVINTTTRPKRNYEKEGVDYYFTKDRKFENIIRNNGFVIHTERTNRGKYGIEKKVLYKTISDNKISLVEENPTNLIKIKKVLEKNKKNKLIPIYILPPNPMFIHLSARLAGRSIKTGENFKDIINSTLGTRQLREFESIINLMGNTKNDVTFIINDDLNMSVKKIKKILSCQ